MTEESSTRELVTVEHAISIYGSDDPTAITRRVVAIAQPLADFIKRQGMSTRISGREYVLAEGWAFMGSMLGVFPITTSIRDLGESGPDGEPRRYGFEATVELRTRDGSVVGGAVAECSRWEPNWRDRDDFALKSMAQTRATGKAYRMAFGFVMKAAGYEATPAEEMGSEMDRDDARRGPYGANLTPPTPRQAPSTAERERRGWGEAMQAAMLKESGSLQQGLVDVAAYLGWLGGTPTPEGAALTDAIDAWLEEFPAFDVRNLAQDAAQHAKGAVNAQA